MAINCVFCRNLRVSSVSILFSKNFASVKKMTNIRYDLYITLLLDAKPKLVWKNFPKMSVNLLKYFFSRTQSRYGKSICIGRKSTSMWEKEELAGLDISSAFVQTPSTEHLILHASTIATLQYSWKVV